jgi:hypothetical protein
VESTFDGSTVHFTFGIPRGNDGSNGTDGAQGPPGSDGSQGSPGNDGAQGPPFAHAVVDAVNTLPPGDQATVESSFDGNTVHLTFGIPQGPEGGIGADGPPFAQAVVDAVNTLPPGEQATVESSFDGNTVHLTFGIPAGLNGSDGEQGIQGEPGMPGMPGAPGEVSFQQLADAIATTSSTSNGVDTLGLAVSDPPTQAEVQQIVNKLDELINALRR